MIYDFEYIPNGWKVINIQKVSRIIGGGTPSTKKEEYWGGTINWFTPTEITNLSDKFISESERKITKEGLENSSAKIIPKNSLLCTTRATVGACAINTTPASTNQGFRNIVPTGNVSVKYLYYFFSQPLMQNRLIRRAQGSTFLEVSGSEMKKTKILLPPKLERKKIVSFLENLDFLIQSTQRLIDKLHECKKGAMQRLFTQGIGHTKFQETKMGWIPKAWKIFRLKTITDEIGDGIHATPKYDDNSNILFINGNNLVNGNIQSKNKTRSVNQEEYKKYKLDLNENTILLSINGTIGNLAYYKGEKVVLGKSVCYIKSGSLLNKNYLYYALSSSYIMKYFLSTITSTTILNLSLHSIRNTPFPLPSLPEQHQIVNILEIIDQKIFNEGEYLEKIKMIKNGLMQLLLTGKKRVPI